MATEVKRKYEVVSLDGNGDVWVVGTDVRETAEHLVTVFEGDGHTGVHIREN